MPKTLQLPYAFFPIELGCIPPHEQLSGIAVMGMPTTPPAETQQQLPTNRKSPALFIGAGLPPIPQKMVAKIQSDEFVDMSELLPDCLDCPKTGHTSEDQAIPRPRRRYVSTILEWIQCFGIYMAVLTQKHPERIPDLLGYQQLIIEASLEYEGDNWLGYDRQFRLTAAATQNTAWGHIDQTLWSLVFSAKAKASRCKYCFSINHMAAECAWAPEQLTSNPVTQPMPLFSQHRPPPLCFKWNSAPGRCPVSGCRYNHICLYCANNPNVFDKRHKGIHCPHYLAGQ